MRELDQLRTGLTALVQKHGRLRAQVRQQQTIIKSQEEQIASLESKLQTLKQQGMDTLAVSAMADSEKLSLQHDLDLIIREIDKLLGRQQEQTIGND